MINKKEVLKMNNAGIAVLVIALIILGLMVLSVWFPKIGTILKWIIRLFFEVFYLVFFWWWFATIQKVRHKKYPDILWWMIRRQK